MLKFINSVGSAEALQMTLAEFLASGAYERQLRSLRKAFREHVARVSAAVSEHFPSGTRITRPAGGFIVWVELPEGVDSVELFRQAMRNNISLGPGVLFSATDRYRNCIRMGCAEPWSPRTEQAIAKLGELARKQLSHALDNAAPIAATAAQPGLDCRRSRADAWGADPGGHQYLCRTRRTNASLMRFRPRVMANRRSPTKKRLG